MGKRKDLIILLREFIENLSRKFIISQVILFGSRISNKFNEFSDVDLIIVSDDFEGMNFFERSSKIYDYWDIDLPADFLCYTTKEFDILKNRISIAKKALEEGIIVK